MRRTVLLMLPLAVLLAWGCVTAPVQEMSDARQAIRAAEDAGARTHAPAQLTEARTLLERAERDLHTGRYVQARQAAEQAKAVALSAREHALAAQAGTRE